MDRVHAPFLRERDDAGDVEVGADRPLALADEIRLVGLEAMDGEAVFLRIDGDGLQTEFGGGAEYADGDLAAIGHEQFSKDASAAGGTGGVGSRNARTHKARCL